MLIEMVGDIITQPLSQLKNYIDNKSVNIIHHGIDQHFQVLTSNTTPTVLISHATPNFFLMDGDRDGALQKMSLYCNALTIYAARGSTLVVVNTLSLPTDRIVGTLFMEQQRLTAELNSMLFDCAAASKMISVADIATVLARAGIDRSINIQNDLVMRMPYTRQVQPAIVAEYAMVIRERFVPRKKLLLLDADNTLWGGVIGEDGVDGISVDTEFPGIVYRRFQQHLLQIANSGILLALVSKNNEADVKQAFDRLDMPLKWRQFVSTRVNWHPKSENISAIAKELNIGLESMVFIDDNSFEIEQVRSALPMVDCYEFDARKADSALSLLSRISDLNTWSLTAEDLTKTEQYQQKNQREALFGAAITLDDYIDSLEIRIEVGINRVAQVQRITQLTNKTNQFNLTTRRFSEAEIITAMQEGQVFDFRVIDKFGDMGIVGVSIVRNGEIEAFLMSCRALGRKIESEMLEYVVSKVAGYPITAIYRKTMKNELVSSFYDENGIGLIYSDSTIKKYRLDKRPRVSSTTRITEVD
jgi:FkbH-like protein